MQKGADPQYLNHAEFSDKDPIAGVLQTHQALQTARNAVQDHFSRQESPALEVYTDSTNAVTFEQYKQLDHDNGVHR